MSGPLRSKGGCWTCKRLRKKKCDETQPHCKTCASLSITCYGFGPKPEWMDHGEREQAITNRIKATVKQNARRKPARDPPLPGSEMRIEPKATDCVASDSSSSLGSGQLDGSTPLTEDDVMKSSGRRSMISPAPKNYSDLD